VTGDQSPIRVDGDSGDFGSDRSEYGSTQGGKEFQAILALSLGYFFWSARNKVETHNVK
jgi:hypothetical protein